MKLTPELIYQSPRHTNAVKDRELILRGNKIPLIENLGATMDQFDVIDFSDNDIRKVDGFPLLPRLNCLLFNNNRIVRIGENLNESLPNLQTLILTNNSIQELSDLKPLSVCINLKLLSLLQNPVKIKPNYRLYCIHIIPSLRSLDFQRIRLRERQQADALFTSQSGLAMKKEIDQKVQSRTFIPGEGLTNGVKTSGPMVTKQGLVRTSEEIKAIKDAIAKASTLEEVERLTHLLKSGQVPGATSTGSATPMEM